MKMDDTRLQDRWWRLNNLYYIINERGHKIKFQPKTRQVQTDLYNGLWYLNEILKKLEIMDWVQRLPEGLETNVGERGSKLSMGQRQLISFARILLVNPMILIMDEATSSVDPLTEVMIQRAINLLLKFTIVIAKLYDFTAIKFSFISIIVN